MDIICESCGAKNVFPNQFYSQNASCDFCGNILIKTFDSIDLNDDMLQFNKYVEDSISRLKNSKILLEERIEAYFKIYDEVIQHKDFLNNDEISLILDTCDFFELLLSNINSKSFIFQIKKFIDYFKNNGFKFYILSDDDYNGPFDIIFKVEIMYPDSIYGDSKTQYVDKISKGLNDKKNGELFKNNLIELYKIIGSLNNQNLNCFSLIDSFNKSLTIEYYGRYYSVSALRKVSENKVSEDVFLIHYLNKLYIYEGLCIKILEFYSFKIDDDYNDAKNTDNIHLVETEYKKLIDYYKDNILPSITYSTSLLKYYERLNKTFNKYFNIELQHQQKKKSSGYCFIASAAMGSYDHPVVMDLRLFRDEWLLKRSWGVDFTNWYYMHGPKAARLIEKSFVLRKLTFYLFVKPIQLLTKIISKI